MSATTYEQACKTQWEIDQANKPCKMKTAGSFSSADTKKFKRKNPVYLCAKCGRLHATRTEK